MPTLTQQLSDYDAGFRRRAPAERVELMETATTQLRATGIESTALRVGAALPALTLPDATGKPVDLKTLSASGPLVIVFYRGGWCPYCNLKLREWQRLLPQLHALSATLVAISPQTSDNSLSTSEKNELAFPVLSDSNLAAAEAFGIAFNLSPDLVELYAKLGNDLPTLNGNGQWVLPIPATFVIDRGGLVTFAHVEADYRQRAEPQDVLDHVRGASKQLVL